MVTNMNKIYPKIPEYYSIIELNKNKIIFYTNDYTMVVKDNKTLFFRCKTFRLEFLLDFYSNSNRVLFHRGFIDDKINKLLDLDGIKESVIYLVVVGKL